VPPEVGELVAQLGAGSFLARERASRRLAEIGLPARESLEQALAHPDAEVRLRAGRVLGVILERDFHVRLEAFAADVEGKSEHHLPGWERFKQSVGSHAAARKLFVEMQRAEPAVLKASEAGAALAGEALARRVFELQEAAEQENYVQEDAPTGRVAALLFAAAPGDVAVSDEVGMYLANIQYQAPFQDAVGRGQQSDLLRKVLAAWISRTEGLGSQPKLQNVMAALRLNMKEGLLPATSLARDAALEAYARPYPILAIAKLGGKEHLPLLQPLLEDESQCNEFHEGSKIYRMQVRDVALLAMLHLTGQNPKDYGFERLQSNEMFLYDPGSVTFASRKKRREAFEKWKAYQEEQGGLPGKAAPGEPQKAPE
jgi:HEAT repeat protein